MEVRVNKSQHHGSNITRIWYTCRFWRKRITRVARAQNNYDNRNRSARLPREISYKEVLWGMHEKGIKTRHTFKGYKEMSRANRTFLIGCIQVIFFSWLFISNIAKYNDSGDGWIMFHIICSLLGIFYGIDRIKRTID